MLHEKRRLLPPPLNKASEDIANFIDNYFNAYNAARLRESCQLFERMINSGATIGVSLSVDGGDAVIEVRDNGMGIDHELLPHVFDLFEQGQRALDRAQGGLGVGLTLVRRIVELHHGGVEAFSAGPGQGAAFRLRLPCLVEVKPDTDPNLVMAYLYKHTELQKTISYNVTALVPGPDESTMVPKDGLSLKDLLRHFLDFRLATVRKRFEYQLRQLKRRIHILEGFKVIFNALDRAIKIIRESNGKPDAADKLKLAFKLDDEQATLRHRLGSRPQPRDRERHRTELNDAAAGRPLVYALSLLRVWV